MDLIYGKCAQTGVLAFLIGSGYSAWASAIEQRGLGAAALREAATDGIRASKVLIAGTAAAGIASFLQHGRYSPKFFILKGDPAASFCAIAAAGYFLVPGASARERAVLALTGGCAAGLISGFMGR